MAKFLLKTGAYRLRTFVPRVLLGAALASTAAGTAAPVSDAAYRAETEAWRQAREARLRAPDGWLTLVGLVWLKPGANRFGSARDNDVILPAAAPAHAGTFVVADRAVTLALEPGAALTLNGGPPRAGAFATDAAPKPDVLRAGTVSWQVIERGDRLGVRVRDGASPARARFAGCRWYPIDPAYRVVARLAPNARAADIVVPDASGGKQTLKGTGTLELALRGQTVRLDPMLDGDDENDQMIVFRDATSGRDTYGGGRFARALRQKDGTFVVDFNRAYAPPCAFTPYATCPLPPPQNRLKVAIEAGERNGGEATHGEATHGEARAAPHDARGPRP